LITIAGGKWTTYRRMAQDTVNRAIEVGSLASRVCRTHELPLHGAVDETDNDALCVYGSDAPKIRELAQQKTEWAQLLHPKLPYMAAEVIWAARHEMARSVEDVLARRTRALFLDASASIATGPAVASLLASELGRDSKWEIAQVHEFEKLAQGYLPRR
jgi:glycerol-3-phosphate dehydrogenase